MHSFCKAEWHSIIYMYHNVLHLGSFNVLWFKKRKHCSNHQYIKGLQRLPLFFLCFFFFFESSLLLHLLSKTPETCQDVPSPFPAVTIGGKMRAIIKWRICTLRLPMLANDLWLYWGQCNWHCLLDPVHPEFALDTCMPNKCVFAEICLAPGPFLRPALTQYAHWISIEVTSYL